MKKILSVLVLLILTVVIIFYFFIGASQNTEYSTISSSNESSVARQIINKSKWALWWPGQQKNDSIYTYKNCQYKIDKILLNGVNVTLFNNDQDSVNGFLQLIFLGADTTKFIWTSTYKFSDNPVKRFTQYFRIKKLGNNVESLLTNIKGYFNKPENIYGLKIERKTISEASYISTKNTFDHYPSTAEIYNMIQSLKSYIQKLGGEEKTYPMLHVEKEGPNIYETMVAIATKNELPSTDKFQLKKMILGNVLVAQVKGGTYRVIKGEEEFDNYIKDYHILSPAIPFQSLVTNRLTETDSTKWVTNLNYPIFQ